VFYKEFDVAEWRRWRHPPCAIFTPAELDNPFASLSLIHDTRVAWQT
jgi:hypothetical protein